LARLQFSAARTRPAAVPFGLIFPFFRVAYPWLGLDIIEPGVLDTIPASPDILAGNRTGMATNTLVQVQHHADLCTDFHFWAPSVMASCVSRPSIQSIF